jgi:hypothetical protein
MAFADQQYRHKLRNVINSLKLAIEVCERSSEVERAEWMAMIESTVDEAIVMLDENHPGEGAG